MVVSQSPVVTSPSLMAAGCLASALITAWFSMIYVHSCERVDCDTASKQVVKCTCRLKLIALLGTRWGVQQVHFQTGHDLLHAVQRLVPQGTVRRMFIVTSHQHRTASPLPCLWNHRMLAVFQYTGIACEGRWKASAACFGGTRLVSKRVQALRYPQLGPFLPCITDGFSAAGPAACW